jgi:hypothetical protein
MTNRKINPNHVTVFQAVANMQCGTASNIAEQTSIDRKKVMTSLRWLKKLAVIWNHDVEDGGRRRVSDSYYGADGGSRYAEAVWVFNGECVTKRFADRSVVEGLLNRCRAAGEGQGGGLMDREGFSC